jgi:hypothetical protein
MDWIVLVLAIIAIGLSVWSLIRSYEHEKREKFKEEKEKEKAEKEAKKLKEEEKAANGCCAGCSGCGGYTKEAIAHMEMEGRSTPTTMNGIIVDVRCYSQNIKNWRDDHVTATGGVMKNCGKFCAKSGLPMGLLPTRPDGSPILGGPVYTLLTAAPGLAKYVQKLVRVDGRLMNDSGALYPLSIEVMDEKTGEFKDINVSPRTPM